MSELWPVGLLLYIQCFIEISVFNANSVDPEQTQHSAGSALFVNYLLGEFPTKMSSQKVLQDNEICIQPQQKWTTPLTHHNSNYN